MPLAKRAQKNNRNHYRPSVDSILEPNSTRKVHSVECISAPGVSAGLCA